MREITTDEFDNVINETSFAVVKYGAEWCVACSDIQPKLESVAATTDVPFYKVDVDNDPELKERAKIKAIPMTLFYKNGKINQFLYGDASEEQIQKKLRMLTA